jgi:hypothetical protein
MSQARSSEGGEQQEQRALLQTPNVYELDCAPRFEAQLSPAA